MKETVEPDLQDRPQDSSFETGMHRVEYSVHTQAPPELCWQVYVDWQRWPLFHPSYGKMQWTTGRAWERGSRLSIEIVHPVRLLVEHVITAFVPGERIAWIDHSGFITIEQWVFFRKDADGGTRVETWADLVGPATVKGVLALPLFKQFTKKWYNEFAGYCDRLANPR